MDACLIQVFVQCNCVIFPNNIVAFHWLPPLQLCDAPIVAGQRFPPRGIILLVAEEKIWRGYILYLLYLAAGLWSLPVGTGAQDSRLPSWKKSARFPSEGAAADGRPSAPRPI
jgi:hypothetical protein